MKSEYRAKMCVDALKDLTTEQIEELKVWLKSESTTLMFDYVAKNRLLEYENKKLKETIVRGDRIMVENALKIAKLKSELKQAKADKADAWDEGILDWSNFLDAYASTPLGDKIPDEPTNPYKEEPNHN